MASRSISRELMRPPKRSTMNVVRLERKRPSGASVGSSAGCSSGRPSTRTTWQPTPSEVCTKAECAASRKARPVAISVAEVQHFSRVQFQDGAVHAFRQTEIIGIDDEAALRQLRGIHATSLARAGIRGSGIDPIAALP